MNFQLGRNDPNLQRYIELNKQMIPKAMRMFTVEVYRELTIATPVDTGRARWGWNCSFIQPDFTIPTESPGRQKNYYGLDAGRAEKTFTISAISGNETLYIANAVPYIVKLNDGWSQQAPARFFELCFENAVQKMMRYFQGSE